MAYDFEHLKRDLIKESLPKAEKLITKIQKARKEIDSLMEQWNADDRKFHEDLTKLGINIK